MRTTRHRDGTVSLRMTRDELATLEANTLYGRNRWQAIVADMGPSIGDIDKQIFALHEAQYDEVHAFLEGLRS